MSLTYLKIKIEGYRESEENLSPNNTDISELKNYIVDIENFIRGDYEGKDRPNIYLTYSQGSICFESNIEGQNNLFLSEDLEKLSGENRFNKLNEIKPKRATIIEKWQNYSIDNKYHIYIESNKIPTSILISPETNYKINKEKIIQNELIIYGVITDIGGKTTPNIHVQTPNYGEVIVDCKREQIKKDKTNRLYKEYGLRISALQKEISKEIVSAEFMEFVDYDRYISEESINKFIESSKNYWDDVSNPEEWVRNLRGD